VSPCGSGSMLEWIGSDCAPNSEARYVNSVLSSSGRAAGPGTKRCPCAVANGPMAVCVKSDRRRNPLQRRQARFTLHRHDFADKQWPLHSNHRCTFPVAERLHCIFMHLRAAWPPLLGLPTGSRNTYGHSRSGFSPGRAYDPERQPPRPLFQRAHVQKGRDYSASSPNGTSTVVIASTALPPIVTGLYT
jgi:hypothetical protein